MLETSTICIIEIYSHTFYLPLSPSIMFCIKSKSMLPLCSLKLCCICGIKITTLTTTDKKRWQIMRRSNQDKIVTQIYLRDWSMKAEILRKAQMYENTIMHSEHNKNDCTSNKIHNDGGQIMSSSCLDDNGSNENIKLYAPTLHCNRSGIYLEKGTEASARATASSTSINSNNNNNIKNDAVNDNKLCDNSASSSDDTTVSLKFKSNKIRRSKKENVLRMRKYKDIFNMIKPMIAIDKL